MATYIIGDVQGCYAELQSLLARIDYDPTEDTLGFVGDLVNRGPESLKTLRFIKSLNSPLVVLGNHDLHLLAMGYGAIPVRPDHKLMQILQADDKMELLEWLRKQPILYCHDSLKACLVHAGIPPQWSLEEAQQYASEVETMLRGPDFLDYLKHLHGDEPSRWEPELNQWDRLRYISNAFTRMRFCSREGELEIANKTKATSDSAKFKPWFQWRDQSESHQILFGHWAALEGRCDNPNIKALDTGCVWGGKLTALRLEDQKLFQVDSFLST